MNSISASILRNIGVCTSTEKDSVVNSISNSPVGLQLAESLEFRLKLWQQNPPSLPASDQLMIEAIGYIRLHPRIIADMFVYQSEKHTSRTMELLLVILSIYSNSNKDVKLLSEFFQHALGQLIHDCEDLQILKEKEHVVFALIEVAFLATFCGAPSGPITTDPVELIGEFNDCIGRWLKSKDGAIFGGIIRFVFDHTSAEWQREMFSNLLIDKLMWLFMTGCVDQWTLSVWRDPFTVFDQFAMVSFNALQRDDLRQSHQRLSTAARRWQQEPNESSGRLAFQLDRLFNLLMGSKGRNGHAASTASSLVSGKSAQSVLIRTVHTASRLLMVNRKHSHASSLREKRSASFRLAPQLLQMLQEFIVASDSIDKHSPAILRRLLKCPTCLQPIPTPIIPFDGIHAGITVDYPEFHSMAMIFYRRIRPSWLYRETCALLAPGGGLLPPTRHISNTIITKSIDRLMEQLEMPHLLSADDPALFAVLLIRYWQTIAFLLVTCTSNSGGIPSDMKQILSFEPPPVGLLNRLLFNTFPANSTDRSSQQYCSPISLVFETIHQLERQRSESMRRLTGNGWPVKRLVECINAFSALLTLDFDAAVTTDSESLTDMAMIKSQNSNSAAVDWRYRAHKRLLDRLAGVQSPLAKLGVIDRLEHRVVQALRSPTAVYSGSSKDGNSSTFSSTQSTDRIIDSMQAIVGRYYPRGKGCRRLLFDVQLVVLLVPAPVLNMTAAGKAFWDLTVALMDLKRCFVDDCGDDDSSIYNL